MQVGIMKTDGGPHSAEKWAVVTAGQILQVASDSESLQAIEGRRLELKIIDILVDHHTEVQTEERGKLAEHGCGRLGHELDCECHNLDDKVEQIANAAKGTAFEAHFAKPETKAYIRNVLGQHFATSMDIERSYHADANADDPLAQEYRAQRGF